jgi:hypothetical protein
LGQGKGIAPGEIQKTLQIHLVDTNQNWHVLVQCPHHQGDKAAPFGLQLAEFVYDQGGGPVHPGHGLDRGGLQDAAVQTAATGMGAQFLRNPVNGTIGQDGKVHLARMLVLTGCGDLHRASQRHPIGAKQRHGAGDTGIGRPPPCNRDIAQPHSHPPGPTLPERQHNARGGEVQLPSSPPVIATHCLCRAARIWWPAGKERDLARAVAGFPDVDRMPPSIACLAVAIAVLVAAIPLALALTTPAVSGWPWLVAPGAGLVFLARGLIGFTRFWARLTPEQPFRRLDRRLYSPLITALGVVFLLNLV